MKNYQYCLGYADFVDFCLVITKLDWLKGSFLCILGSFLKAKGIFLGC